MSQKFPIKFDWWPRLTRYLESGQWVDFYLEYEGKKYNPFNRACAEFLYERCDQVNIWRKGGIVPEHLDNIDLCDFLESILRGELSTYFDSGSSCSCLSSSSSSTSSSSSLSSSSSSHSSSSSSFSSESSSSSSVSSSSSSSNSSSLSSSISSNSSSSLSSQSSSSSSM